MTDASGRADVLFMEAELRRLMMPVESLEDLCLRSVHTFLPRRNDAAPVIAALLKDRLIKRIPTSLVRVGDGEGNVLALTREAVHPVYLDSFNAKLFGQVGMTLPEDEARMLCSKIRHALCAANFIGFRSFDAARPEFETISNALANGQIGAAVGILYAQAFLQDQLVRGHFSSKLITSMWIHLALIPCIGDIMEPRQRSSSSRAARSLSRILKPALESDCAHSLRCRRKAIVRPRVRTRTTGGYFRAFSMPCAPICRAHW